MVLFVGNPTNVVICEGFSVNNVGFSAYTVLPFLACSLTSLITLGIQFHRDKYIQRKLNVSGNLDVRAVLLDPIGACVGGALLGTCLIVIIVVSFFKIDVWKISLPFAGLKFFFDLAWDTYRYRTKPPVSEDEGETSVEDEEDNDVMLRQLRKMKTTATISMDGFDLESITNGAANGANGHADAVNAEESIKNRVVTFDQGTRSSPTSSPQTREVTRSNTVNTLVTSVSTDQGPSSPSKSKPLSSLPIISSFSNQKRRFSKYLSIHFPTLHTALPRLPFALVPFAFAQFILIEALNHQGWINIFARWLVIATKREMFKTIWLVGVLGVLLCNTSGTNIGATILLTKIVRAAASSYVPPSSGPEVNIPAFLRSAAIALAIASNVGAVSFTFSASLAGLLWRQILSQKNITVTQVEFARWNLAPIVVMTTVGLAVVSAEMAVLY